MGICRICDCEYAEEHHVVFRSQNHLIIESPINKIYLCAEHHRGDTGPHGKRGRENDIKYKLELQEKLFKEIPYYPTEEEIKKVLKIKDKNMYKLLKTIRPVFKNGIRYNKEEVIRRIMGGKIYV